QGACRGPRQRRQGLLVPGQAESTEEGTTQHDGSEYLLDIQQDYPGNRWLAPSYHKQAFVAIGQLPTPSVTWPAP
ncbi:MAG: hypothetical protein QXU79_04635, partial [Candidatus Micrarchaeaceae archaeon]